MVSRNQRGYTMLEIVIAMAIFGTVLFILVLLTAEMTRYEKSLPVNFMKHPQVSAVMARLRADVVDAYGVDPYPTDYLEYTQGEKVLIIKTFQDGSVHTVVWDFRTPGQVTRKLFRIGVEVSSWTARGTSSLISELNVTGEDPQGQQYGVRLKGVDTKGKLAIDQVFFPRAHD